MTHYLYRADHILRHAISYYAFEQLNAINEKKMFTVTRQYFGASKIMLLGPS